MHKKETRDEAIKHVVGWQFVGGKVSGVSECELNYVNPFTEFLDIKVSGFISDKIREILKIDNVVMVM